VNLTLVDVSNQGHHLIYMKNIFNIVFEKEPNANINIILPALNMQIHKEFNGNPKLTLYNLNFPIKRTYRSKIRYHLRKLVWLSKVLKLIKVQKPDIIHFLTLDAIYQQLAIIKPLWKIANCANCKIISTLHHIPNDPLKLKVLRQSSKLFKTVIVHSEYLEKKLKNTGIMNTYLIDYPSFHEIVASTKEKARSLLRVPQNDFLFLIIGETRYEKGLDILLEATKYIKKKSSFVIAGKELHFNKEYILEQTSGSIHSFFVNLRFLTDFEFSLYLDAADCVIVPYRTTFNGASGPMIEAIKRRVPVIGPGTGNLGYLIKKYKLGITFEPENPVDLAKAVEQVLNGSWKWKSVAEDYRKRIDVQLFRIRYYNLYKNIDRL